MTVTITVLAGADHANQSGSFIMCADTLITYCADGVPLSANQEGTKLYDLPHGFYVAIADDISRSHQVVSFLYHQMGSLQPSDANFVDMVKLCLDRTAEYVRLWMRREVLAEYGISLKEFLEKKKLVKRDEIADEIRNRVLSTQLSIAGFTAKGNPLMFFTDCVNTQEGTNPGIFCGGAGQATALDWLNFRGQNCFMSIARSYYHVREAKQFAEVCPVVGPKNQTILIRHNRPIANLSIATPTTEKWFEGMFPRTTDWLEKKEAWSQLSDAYGINS